MKFTVEKRTLKRKRVIKAQYYSLIMADWDMSNPWGSCSNVEPKTPQEARDQIREYKEKFPDTTKYRIVTEHTATQVTEYNVT